MHAYIANRDDDRGMSLVLHLLAVAIVGHVARGRDTETKSEAALDSGQHLHLKRRIVGEDSAALEPECAHLMHECRHAACKTIRSLWGSLRCVMLSRLRPW